MGDLHLKEILVFLDDLIIFSSTLEEHETRLLKVLQRLKDYGLKLSPEKCKFLQTSVRYLGHIVSEKVNLAFGLPVRDAPFASHSQYVQNLRSRLEES